MCLVKVSFVYKDTVLAYRWISKWKWNWKRLKLCEIDADLYSIHLCMDWRMKLKRGIHKRALCICMRDIRRSVPLNSIRFHMVCVRDGSSFHIRIFLLFFHFHDETKHKINDWKRLKANHTVNCTYIWMSMISSESNRTELTVVAKERTYPGRMCDNFDRNSLAKIKIEPNRMERNGMEKNRFTMIAGDFIFVHLIENARSLCWLWFATHICLSSHQSIE